MVKLIANDGRIILNLTESGRTFLKKAAEMYGEGSEQYRFVRSIVMLSDHEDRTASDDKNPIALNLCGIITPSRQELEGQLVRATAGLWTDIVLRMQSDWSVASEVSPEKWEEIIAGAFDVAGFDEVVLTPRSGDHGRDVIAKKNGIGSIKILCSVKAYSPHRSVSYDAIRSLVGVLAGERDASKGIIITTSEFPPKIANDPYIAPFIPYRLELINSSRLRDWLKDLVTERTK